MHHCILTSSVDVRYDAETDLREQREAKDKQLKHIEETKKRVDAKG